MNLLFEALLVISEGESNEVKSKDDKGLVKSTFSAFKTVFMSRS